MARYIYVNTDNSLGPWDGLARATGFLTLQSAIADFTGLSGGGDGVVPAGGVFFKCAGVLLDDLAVDITGFTSQSDANRINIWGDDNTDDSAGGGDPVTYPVNTGRYIGDLRWSDSHYRLVAATTPMQTLKVQQGHTYLEAFQARPPPATNRHAVNFQFTANTALAECAADGLRLGGALPGVLLRVSSNSFREDKTVHVTNNIGFFDFDAADALGIDIAPQSDNINANVYNNTIHNATTGISVPLPSNANNCDVDIRNNTVFGSRTVDYATSDAGTGNTIAEDFNAGEDGTFNQANDQDILDQAATFTNVGIGDYTPFDANSILVENAVIGPLVPEDIREIARLAADTIGAFFLAGGAPPVTTSRPRIQIIG